MKSIFFLSLLIVIYTYFGYPAAIALLAQFRARRVRKAAYEPRITILIAAYNEERDIGRTIDNKLGLDYLCDKREIIVISDGSSDATDEIVRTFSERGVKLLRQEPRAGKTSALNLAAPLASGEILVFSDANSVYAPDALKILVRCFADPEVGYVTGKMVYTNPDGSPIGDGCSAYMKYENQLRKWETAIGSIVGVDGGIDAVRKSLYRPMHPDQLPDFVLPLKVVEQGYRVVYEEGAELREQALGKASEEYRMRVRVSLRALWALRELAHMLNPLRYGCYAVMLFSHKLLRYATFVFLTGMYISSALLLGEGPLYSLAFSGQTVFYLLAWAGWCGERSGRNIRLAYIPYYFSLLSIASAHAWMRFLRGEKQVLWKPRTG